MDGVMDRARDCETMALDEKTLRLAFGLVTTAVTVVAAQLEPESYAVSVNSTRALSLDPALMILCPRKASRLGTMFATSKRFTVNVLRDDQRDLARLFSGLWRGRSAPAFHFAERDGGAFLDGAFVSLGCVPRRAIDLGTHVMITARVVACRGGDRGAPLLRTGQARRDARELIGLLRAI
jgi:flavin-dependent trigonelline monooxygenase, reductase component